MKTLILILLVISMMVSCSRESSDPTETNQKLSLKSGEDTVVFTRLASVDYIFYEPDKIRGVVIYFDEADSSRLNNFTSKHVGRLVTLHVNSHQVSEAKLVSELILALEVGLNAELDPEVEHALSIMINGDIGRHELPKVEPEINDGPHDNAHDAVESMLRDVFKE